MNQFSIIALVFLIIGIVHDYKRDPGQNRKAKVFHALCLGLICTMYANTIGAVIVFLKHLDRTYHKYSVAVGLVPGSLHFLIYLLDLILAIVVLFTALQMIKRSRKAKTLFLYFFPFLALIEVFNFYRGWLSGGEEIGLNHAVILFMGLVIYGSIAVALSIIYNSTFMNIFFDTPLKNQNVPASLILAPDSDSGMERPA